MKFQISFLDVYSFNPKLNMLTFPTRQHDSVTLTRDVTTSNANTPAVETGVSDLLNPHMK